LWFERWPGGTIKQPEEWRGDVLASVTVHDLPPTAGYLAGEHVRIRSDLGLLNRSVSDELRVAELENSEWVAVLRERGWLPGDDAEVSVDQIVAALHRFVAATPARLIGVSLPDLVGDTRAQNQPGTDQEYPNWRIPLADRNQQPVPLEELPDAPLVEPVLAALRDRD
jgi:4-alpha-glucanotransferase